METGIHSLNFNLNQFGFVVQNLDNFFYSFFDVENGDVLGQLTYLFAEDREVKYIMDEEVNKFGCRWHFGVTFADLIHHFSNLPFDLLIIDKIHNLGQLFEQTFQDTDLAYEWVQWVS